MKRIVVLLLSIVLTVSIFAGCTSSSGKAFTVGYAKVEITPDDSVPMSGFGTEATRFSTTVLDPLYATCVAFTDSEGTTVLMFGLDLLSTNGTLLGNLRSDISKETGIPFENIMFSATHTHSGSSQRETSLAPVVKANEKIASQCMQAAKDALADRAPAKMYTSFARPEKLNFVRHFVLDDGSYRGWRSWEVRKQMIGHTHKADNLLQMVKFTREGEDKKDVVIVNWQAHYAGADDVNYNGLSADYPGVLRSELEKNLNCHAAFVLGGSGNLVSNSTIEGEDITEDYIAHGKALAKYAIEAANNFKEAELGNIYIKEEVFQAYGIEGPVLYAIGFGDFACVFAPFEVFDKNAKNVREASKYKYTFYASCANSSDGNMYLPDLEAYRYPAYESCGHSAVPNYDYAKMPKGSAEELEKRFIAMLDELFAVSGNTEKEKDEGYITPDFIPISDGIEYTIPNPGDTTAYTEGTGGNDLYCFALLKNNKMTKMLADSKETVELVLSKTTTKLLFDERNVVVGIAE